MIQLQHRQTVLAKKINENNSFRKKPAEKEIAINKFGNN